MKIRRLIFERLLFLPLIAFSCADNKEQSYDSFDKFAGNLIIQPSENCDKDCVSLKKEFRYVVYTGEKIYCTGMKNKRNLK